MAEESKNGIAQVSLELLFHYRCSYCDTYLSAGDDLPKYKEVIYCRRCGLQNEVRQIALGPGITPIQIMDLLLLINHEAHEAGH